MICFLFHIWFWLMDLMTFSQPEVVIEAIINNNNPDWILDYDFAAEISTSQLVNSIAPILNYDMMRYVDDVFINSHPYFLSYYNVDYKDYLNSYVLQLGKNTGRTVEEAYIQVLVSTLKKMYVYNWPNNQLDSLDYFILDWAKNNMTMSDISDWRDIVIYSPQKVQCIYFNVDVKLF